MIILKLTAIFLETFNTKEIEMETINYIESFDKEIIDLVEKYKLHLKSDQISEIFLIHGTTISLNCAPNELIGIKHINESINRGIKFYEEFFS